MVKVVNKFTGVSTTSFCGWERVIKGLIASGELQLRDGESVNQVILDDNGITFFIN